MPRYPRQISAGANNAVIALSETEVAKIFTGDTRSDIGSEGEKMRFANGVNGLVVRFLRLDYHEPLDADVLIMERLYPIDFRAWEWERRELWLEVFEDELTQLHNAGFVHRDLRSVWVSPPSGESEGAGGQYFDNILLTENGLRLIDVGISALQSQVGDKLFQKYLQVEREELAQFRTFFLDR